MIVSAISLWKKFNLKTPLDEEEWDVEEKDGARSSNVLYSGHKVSDGSVRIYARFFRPIGSKIKGKVPAIVLLHDIGKKPDDALLRYFTEKGYAVLMPDYSGRMNTDIVSDRRTEYPPSLDYGNYERAQGLYEMTGVDADKTTWFEWTYVALFSIEYLKTREDIGSIGIVGIRTGGDIAWQAMLSPDVKCGVPINSVGWYSFLHIAKFSDNIAHSLSDDRHRYIAAVEAQSYAQYVKCPVLMLCGLRETEIDCDRAYDTYVRIGNKYDNALAYSPECGNCIGPNGLTDMDLFLEKNLKGREIYIPDTLNVKLKECNDGIEVEVLCDEEGLLEEAGIFYAEADVKTKSAYRDWRCVFKTQGRTVKKGKTGCKIKPFAGASAVFVYAYAKYINGFRVMSKVTCKRLSNPDFTSIRNRSLLSGTVNDCFEVAHYDDYSVGGIFLEKEVRPQTCDGYGEIAGVYSDTGIRTYRISSPAYVPQENALLEFDLYVKESQTVRVDVEVADMDSDDERYTCFVPVKGGGKWKRIILKAADFKGEKCGIPLKNFSNGSALVISPEAKGREYVVTNLLWL